MLLLLMKIDQILVRRMNKQPFILMLIRELEKNTAKFTMHDEMLIFCLSRRLFNLLAPVTES